MSLIRPNGDPVTQELGARRRHRLVMTGLFLRQRPTKDQSFAVSWEPSKYRDHGGDHQGDRSQAPVEGKLGPALDRESLKGSLGDAALPTNR